MNRIRRINGKEYLDFDGEVTDVEGLERNLKWIEIIDEICDKTKPNGNIVIKIPDFYCELNRPWNNPDIKTVITRDMIWAYFHDKGWKVFVSGVGLDSHFEVFAIKPIDRYASMLPVLEHILKQAEIKEVLEFGPGDNSTPLFVNSGCNLETVEMQSLDWYNKIKQDYKRAKVHYAEGAMRWKELHYKQHYDLILVDGHMDSRPEVANWAKDRTDIVVIHDTEADYYGWDRLDFGEEWKRFVYTDIEPNTTVFYKTDLNF